MNIYNFLSATIITNFTTDSRIFTKDLVAESYGALFLSVDSLAKNPKKAKTHSNAYSKCVPTNMDYDFHKRQIDINGGIQRYLPVFY